MREASHTAELAGSYPVGRLQGTPGFLAPIDDVLVRFDGIRMRQPGRRGDDRTRSISGLPAWVRMCEQVRSSPPSAAA